MGLDIAGLLLIVLFFVRGYMKGLVVALFSFVAILLGLAVSLRLSQGFASWLLEKGYAGSGWAPVIAYVVLFAGVVIAVNIIARMIQKALEGLMLGVVNKMAGGVFYAILGLILWSSLLWLADKIHLIPTDTLAASKTAPWFLTLAPWFFETLGRVLPFVKDTFANLTHYFDAVNNKHA